MNWQGAVERTVTGLGYDLVDAERSVGGLLRVMIDHPSTGADDAAAERFITVDDCEKVTRQLQHVLEVDAVAYERLEVSSPGLDRPLKKAADYARFAGSQVELTLKVPFQGRKKFSGELSAQPGIGDGDRWRLVLTDPTQGRAQRRAAAATAASGVTPSAEALALDFTLDEVREARLVPVVDFKGRRSALPNSDVAPNERPQAADLPPPPPAGGKESGKATFPNELEGDRIQ